MKSAALKKALPKAAGRPANRAGPRPLGDREHDRKVELHPYAARVLADLSATYWWEREFLEAVEEVLLSLGPVLDANPAYEAERILERLVEPERVISFRVAWLDDRNQVCVNHAWRVQHSSVLGPYKGGTRFHSSVSLDALKFLAFEQTFKNSLTGLSLGSGKGGADFHPAGHSEREIMRFCQAYMVELHRHIGPDVDVPAGDIGVGTREIGYLFGHYRRLTQRFHGVFTGKAAEWGGSLLRPEATGFGVVYFADEVLRARGESLAGKTAVVSGFGNVAWGAVTKLAQMGAKVIAISGPDGFVHDPDGISGEKIDFMLELRRSGQDAVAPYAERFGVDYAPGQRPWGLPCDLALPCAIQNEFDAADAERLIAGGCRFLIEGANKPLTPEAIEMLGRHDVVFVPGKAANAGGVAVSGLEMSQNSMRASWTREDVDAKLRAIIASIHAAVLTGAERCGCAGDYQAGANIVGFMRVADAMLDQGVG